MVYQQYFGRKRIPLGRSLEKTQEKCFDHTILAKLLSKKFKKGIYANDIKISELEFDADMAVLKFTFDEKIISFNPNQQELTIVESKTKDPKRDWGYWGSRFDETNNPPIMSPDSTMLAFIRNHNLYIKNNSTNKETRLSYDGAPGFFYSTYIKWSPDGKKIMAYKVRPGDERKIYFVESTPEDQFQPKLQSRDYLKPGDEVPFKSPQLFLVHEKKHIQVPTDEFSHQFGLNNLVWREDSSAFTFEYNQRGHQAYKVIAVDATTGTVKVLVNEVSKTFIDYSSKKYRYDIEDGKEIIWTSERDGWNHIYFYDVAVSSCGCHDNRMDKIWWNEQFMGYPIGPHYEACSNVENAGQMGGDLMLILGEVDDNVDPASTMQFANALIKANKDFELVTIPGMGHSSGGEFGERKRKDFFVKHLMDVDPPSWEEIYN